MKPIAETISSPLSDQTYPVFRVPPEAIAKAPAHPRLRRSSAISRFAVVAGLAALEDAQVKLDAAAAERTALIFAISNGGVIYTKRFYHEIVESGAQAASPLLFPETVFNAPASHLAAILGITGASYTLVGDGAVGLARVENGGRFDAESRRSIAAWSSVPRKPTGSCAMRIAAGACCARLRPSSYLRNSREG